MKALVFNMLTIAATFAAMTACTSESDPVDEVNPKDAKVEIKLNAGVVDVQTKAGPTNESNKEQFATDIPIQLLRWDITGEAPSSLTWSNVKNVSATASGNAITFETKQYYDKDGANTYFIGFYPVADGTNIILDTENGNVTFKNLKGETDILHAELINAGSKLSTTPTNIQFSHVLSQIKINLKGNDIAQKTFGNIKKITLKDVPSEFNMGLGIAKPTITIAEGSSTNDIDVMTSTEGVALSQEGKEYTTLVPPTLGTSATGKKLVIEIETTVYDSTNPLTINVEDINDGTQSGIANNINLTFKDQISVTTGITDWKDSDKSSDHDIDNK